MTESERLLKQAPERKHYQQFLSAQFLLHTEIASHARATTVNRGKNDLLDWPDCLRIPLLAADLSRLGVVVDPSGFARLTPGSHGFTLGLVYVCEGSCIGNQQLLSAMKRYPEFNSWRSRSFLESCKQGFSIRWKTLLKSMEALAVHGSAYDGSGYDQLELGALAGFDLYRSLWNALEEKSIPA